MKIETNAMMCSFWKMELYYTPFGHPINYNEFSPNFISGLIDPIAYFFERYDILEYIPYFQEWDIDIIRSLQEDNIRNLPMYQYAQQDLIELSQMLRQYGWFFIKVIRKISLECPSFKTTKFAVGRWFKISAWIW